MKRKCIMFQGISGCGKGTQAALLQEFLNSTTKYSTFIMEAGHGFRSFLSHDSYMAEVAGEVTEKGGFQPAFMSIWNWTNILINEMKKDQHIIFDGSPRKGIEPSILDDLWEYLDHHDPVYVFYIKISDDTARERLGQRERHDDSLEVIENRLKNFKEASRVILKYYRENPRYTFVEIDGEESIEEIHNTIKKTIS
jgi:adenylate kinase family enzyme